MDLTKKKCIPCEAGVLPLAKEEAGKLIGQVDDWHLADGATHISKEYTFKNFLDAMSFANKIADIAEQEGHHPDLSIDWGRVGVTLTTHAIGGLSENDFILAAKIDQIG